MGGPKSGWCRGDLRGLYQGSDSGAIGPDVRSHTHHHHPVGDALKQEITLYART